MKVTVWGINYTPELTGIAPYNTALCRHLVREGHTVRMVTAFPYYPEWEKRPEDRRRLFRTDSDEGVAVHRCWHYVPRQPRAWQRVAHEASFVLFSTLRLLALPRPDVYVVVSPPLLLGAAASLISRLKGAPFVFHVQDLQPDAAASLGMIRSAWLLRRLYGLERLVYRRAACVSGISLGMCTAIRAKGIPAHRLVLFPNGVELPDPHAMPERGRFRQRVGIGPDEFLAVYSGNLGVKQGLSVLVEAAQRLQGARIRIVICGSGAQRSALEAQIREQGLSNLTLLPLQPPAHYREMLVDTDLALIPQQPGSGSCFLPSKLWACLAYARPVLAVAGTSGALQDALDEGRFGWRVDPGEPGQLAAALQALRDLPAERVERGLAGRCYAQRFALSRVLSAYTHGLRALVEGACERSVRVVPPDSRTCAGIVPAPPPRGRTPAQSPTGST